MRDPLNGKHAGPGVTEKAPSVRCSASTPITVGADDADNESLASISIKSENITSRLSYVYLRDLAAAPMVAPVATYLCHDRVTTGGGTRPGDYRKWQVLTALLAGDLHHGL